MLKLALLTWLASYFPEFNVEFSHKRVLWGEFIGFFIEIFRNGNEISAQYATKHFHGAF
jgi:hypothetical protein